MSVHLCWVLIAATWMIFLLACRAEAKRGSGFMDFGPLVCVGYFIAAVAGTLGIYVVHLKVCD